MAETRKPIDKDQARILKDLKEQGRAVLTWGLANPAPEGAVVGMGLLMREKLEDEDDPARVAAMAQLATAFFDKTTLKMPRVASAACKQGCTFCCHSMTPAAAPEVFRVARLLNGTASESNGIDVAAIKGRIERQTTDATTDVQLKNDPCSMLFVNSCSIYLARPLSCRQFFSPNAAGCEDAFESRREDFPFISGAVNLGVMMRGLLIGATHSLGLTGDVYDLSSALAISLRDETCEARWLAGEDVFAAAHKVPQASTLKETVARWSETLKGFCE